MSLESDIHTRIWEEIRQASTCLVVSHIRPDGDAIGALLAMGLGLKSIGKQVQMVLRDGVPGSSKHLEGAADVRGRAEGEFDLIISVDASDLKRLGGVLDGYRKPDLNIDHHVTNDGFGRVNLIQPKAVATSEILAEHLTHWGMKITPGIANALMTGILADTLGFRTSNMKPQTLHTAADLMDAGADLPEQYAHALLRRPFTAARYWGQGLSSLQRKDRLAWATLTLADREACGYPGSDDADLINVISSIDDFDISMIFVEQKNGTVKVSWRSVPGLDVSRVALEYGGGGHPAAAGADIPGTLDSIKEKVLKSTYNMWVSWQTSGKTK
jgi:phosphoesterase RecJ-like protein